MIGLLSKAKVYLIMAAGFAVFAAGAYFYYTHTQAKLREYETAVTTLEISLDSQKKATESLQNDIRVMGATLRTLNIEFEKSRQIVSDLEGILFSDGNGNLRDIGKNAVEDPEAMRQAINTGTDEVFNCISSLSGRESTDGNQVYINCPDSDNANRVR